MTSNDDVHAIVRTGHRVLTIEAAAVHALAERLDERFAEAVQMVLHSAGRVILIGLGKSGHVARKIAATLASTGTPAYFVHAAEAVHGDLGMITHADVVIALSNSGENSEILTLVPLIKRRGGRLIALTGNPTSSLAQAADLHLDAAVSEEACPHNLAPTASTTAALALGDALAVALLELRGFSADDFARSHPGGALGRKLLTHVSDVMRPLAEVPVVHPQCPIIEALLHITRGGLGMAVVTENGTMDGQLAGILTDGDLRRAMEKLGDVRHVPVAQAMSVAPHTIAEQRLAVEAVEMMERLRVNQLLAVNGAGHLTGALNMHDLFRAKVV